MFHTNQVILNEFSVLISVGIYKEIQILWRYLLK